MSEDTKKGPEVWWIVSEGNNNDEFDDGEFGVEIDGVPYLYYKWPDAEPCSEGLKYRHINKREFDEVIRRPSYRGENEEEQMSEGE